MSKIKIHLVKSPIGYEKSQRATAFALGFRKHKKVVEQEDNAVIRGMINKISHLVKVEK